MRSPQDVEKELDECMAAAVARGWTITRGITCNPAKAQCCAVGSALIDLEFDVDHLTELVSVLRLSVNEIDQIIRGFDSKSFNAWRVVCPKRDQEFYDIGKRLAKKYIND